MAPALWQAALTEPPDRLQAQRVSDHAPVRVVLQVKSDREQADKPIPFRIARSEAFAQRLRELSALVPWWSIGDLEALQKMKQIQREAANVVMKMEREHLPRSCEAMAALLMALARAVARQQAGLAAEIARRHPDTRDVVRIEAGRVSLRDPVVFTSRLCEARLAEFAGECEPEPSEDNARLARSARRHRLARLWAPVDRRMVLRGVRAPLPCPVLPRSCPPRPRLLKVSATLGLRPSTRPPRTGEPFRVFCPSTRSSGVVDGPGPQSLPILSLLRGVRDPARRVPMASPTPRGGTKGPERRRSSPESSGLSLRGSGRLGA